MWNDENAHSVHHTDKYSQNSSIFWPVSLSDWMFVYELSGLGFGSCCNHLNLRYWAFRARSSLASGIYRVKIYSKNVCDMITHIPILFCEFLRITSMDWHIRQWLLVRMANSCRLSWSKGNWRDCNKIRTHNHLVCKRTSDHLAK